MRPGALLAGLGIAIGLTAGWLLWGRPEPVQEPPVAPGIDSAAARADSLAGQVGALSDSLQALAQRLAHASRPRPAAPLPPRPAPTAGDSALPAYADTLEARLAASEALTDTLRGELATAAVSVQAAADSARAASARLLALASELDTLADRSRALEAERDGLARRVRSLSRPWSIGLGGGVGSDGKPVLGLGVGLTGRLAFLRVDLAGVAGTSSAGPAGLIVGRLGL